MNQLLCAFALATHLAIIDDQHGTAQDNTTDDVPAKGEENNRQTNEAIAFLVRRTESAHSFKFEWVEHHTVLKGSDLIETARQDTPVPKEDVEYELRKVFAFSNGKVRYDFSGRRPSDDYTEYLQHDFQSAFNGSVSKSLHANLTSVSHPCGFFHGEGHPGVGMEVIGTLPLRLTYLTFHTRITGLEADTIWIPKHDGSELLILDSVKGNRKRTLWVQPDRDFAIVKYLQSQHDRPILLVEMSHEEDAEHGWIPARWRITRFSPQGDLLASCAAEVRRYAINPELNDSLFEIDFPPGTVVSRP